MLKTKKTLLREFLDLPPFLIFCILATGVSGILFLWFSGAKINCGINSGIFKCSVSEDSKPTEIYPIHGYYYTQDHEGKSVCAEEKLLIETQEESGHISGTTKGYVHNYDGTLQKTKGKYKGVKSNNTLSIIYTNSSDSKNSDSGIYHLSYKGNIYVGSWIGTDFPGGELKQCPYILVTEKKLTNETCESRWPKIFNVDNLCKEVLPPSNVTV